MDSVELLSKRFYRLLQCKFYINGVKEYTLGEILEKYLSKNFKDLDELLYRCRNYIRDLHYPEDDEEARNCDVFFQRAIMFYSKVEDLICSLPPYKDMDLRRNRLYDLLNEYYWFWEVECEEGNPRWLDYNYHFVTDLPLDTGTTVSNSNQVVFELYSKDFGKGDTVTLGTNGQSSGCVFYSVFAVKQGSGYVLGDVNADGKLDISDIVMMQKWILGDGELTEWKNGDMNKDDVINVFDLCIIKNAVMKNEKNEE